MSVIITGMDMPKHCYDCGCHNGENGECQVTGSYDTHYNEPPRSCPLKSVDGLISGLEAHKWNKNEGSKAIYDSAINDAITYIKEYCEVKE